MEYKNFKNIHKGQKIIVSGCGNSASLMTDPKKQIIIGVNDLSRLYSPDYLVVVNDKTSFKGDRWSFINSTEASNIFTHIKKLDVDEKKKVLIMLGRYGGCDLEKDQVDYTSNSSYIACIIAAYMGASTIGLLGVDFSPNHFFGKTGEHSLAKKINVINKEYEQLNFAMARKGIKFVNLSNESRITSVPKCELKDFELI